LLISFTVVFFILSHFYKGYNTDILVEGGRFQDRLARENIHQDTIIKAEKELKASKEQNDYNQNVITDIMGQPLPPPKGFTTEELKALRYRKLKFYEQSPTIVKIEPTKNLNGMSYPNSNSNLNIKISNDETKQWKKHIKNMDRIGKKQWKMAGKENKLVGLEKEYFSCMKCDKCNRNEIFGLKCHYNQYCDICRQS